MFVLRSLKVGKGGACMQAGEEIPSEIAEADRYGTLGPHAVPGLRKASELFKLSCRTMRI